MSTRSPEPTQERGRSAWPRPAEPTRIVVGAEHAVVRAGLAGIVGAVHDLHVVAMASSAGAALDACGEQQPCVAVVDYSLPDLDAPQLVRRMRRAGFRVAVVVVLQPSWEYVSRALHAGASAAVSRSAPSDLLLQAVRSVVRGERFIEPEFIERFLAELRTATPATPERRLSDRELQVLTRLAMGWRSKELATALDLSSSTIDSHRRRILRKLGLRTTADLTRFAVRRGLVRLDG